MPVTQRIDFEQLEYLKPLPPTADIASSPDGDYTIYKPDERVLPSDGPELHTDIWFTTPALDTKTIERIESLQFYVQCHDQGYASDEKAGNWTWFELVILENPTATVPRVSSEGVELVWKSHFNRFLKEEYDWRAGELFPDTHALFGHLEDGNAVGIRLCARFDEWKLFAKDGYLVVELVHEIGPRETPVYKDLLQNVDHLQQTFQDVNALMHPDFAPLEVTGLNRADSFKGGRPLRVLALDGGGIRGISSLLLLQEVLKETTKKPHEIFDLIAGTSTGGLIAIMLGRLKMGVGECIDAYNGFASTVFAGGKSYLEWAGSDGEFYDHTILERVVKQTVKTKLGDENALLYEAANPDCKVFVTAIDADALGNRPPVCLRSYDRPLVGNDLGGLKIWEAARATSAAPNYFAPIKIGNYRFVDGGLGANNPIGWLWNEVLGMFGPQRETSCFLSIGTGIPPNAKLGEMHWWYNNKEYIEQFAGIATNSQLSHILFRSLLDAYAPLPGLPKYWRLNIGTDPADDDKNVSKKDYIKIGEMDDVSQMDFIKAFTAQYMILQQSLISDCRQKLQQSLAQ